MISRRAPPKSLHTTGGATRPWITAGYATAQWRARLSPPLPTATRHVVLNQSPSLGRLENRTALTDPVQANIIVSDPRKQTSGGRHQIGTLAGFKSESVAGFILECLAGFVGIRIFTVLKGLPYENL